MVIINPYQDQKTFVFTIKMIKVESQPLKAKEGHSAMDKETLPTRKHFTIEKVTNLYYETKYY